MRTLSNMDSPWRRLPWTLPTALLIWSAALWGLACFMAQPAYRPAEQVAIDAQLCDLPASTETQIGEAPVPAQQPPAVVPKPKPLPHVKPRLAPVARQAGARIDQKTDVLTKGADAPGGDEATPAVNNSADAGSNEGGGSLETSFGSANGPRFLHKTMPVYPPLAKRLQKEGNVLLRLTIDERGLPVNVEIVKSAGFGFDEEAVKAVQSSTFVPAKKEGKPLACKVLLPIRFILIQS